MGRRPSAPHEVLRKAAEKALGETGGDYSQAVTVALSSLTSVDDRELVAGFLIERALRKEIADLLAERGVEEFQRKPRKASEEDEEPERGNGHSEALARGMALVAFDRLQRMKDMELPCGVRLGAAHRHEVQHGRDVYSAMSKSLGRRARFLDAILDQIPETETRTVGALFDERDLRLLLGMGTGGLS